MFCTNCGKLLAEGNMFCTNCGTKRPTIPAPAPAAPVVDVAPTASASPVNEPVVAEPVVENTEPVVDEPVTAQPVIEAVAPPPPVAPAPVVEPVVENATPAAEPAPTMSTPATYVPPVTPSPVYTSRVPQTDWKNSYFDGGAFALLGLNLLIAFLSAISLGLAYPALYCMKQRWFYRHKVVGGYRLKFTGTGGQLFGKYLLWSFLSIITFGIFTIWLPIKYEKWATSHVVIDSIEK